MLWVSSAPNANIGYGRLSSILDRASSKNEKISSTAWHGATDGIDLIVRV
ncbi:hypothetical protein HDEF_0345 [Candidatus Hamiltonella defensa 5AT (Acyrthosiphon pisum)]|uniref:Uncharacterized protein n=1 Tax=Hamiltonella defensa subsp. Acyrthosiphon pisum (strain 5AT) TaxID=572265 RepID=C4K3G2_HAMD5|nr:hypothetical protein HDEF_0345 [Candidatus Hamiltonella defensa 5AT (Acyrthosiphon pisum)]